MPVLAGPLLQPVRRPPRMLARDLGLASLQTRQLRLPARNRRRPRTPAQSPERQLPAQVLVPRHASPAATDER